MFRKPLNRLSLLIQCFVLISHALVISIAAGESNKPFIDSISFPMTNGHLLGPIFTDSRDMLWLNTYGGYLQRFDGAGLSSEFKTKFYYLHIDAWDRLWSDHIFQEDFYPGYLDLKSGKSYSVRFEDETGKLLNLKQDYKITNDKQTLWLITLKGELYKATLSADLKLQLKLHKESSIDIRYPSLKTSDKVLSLDSLGNVWFSIADQLLRYNPKTKIWTDFSRFLNPGTRSDWGLVTATTNKGTMWLASEGYNQLLRIDQHDQVTSLTIPYRILDIQQDRLRNTIWIGTTNGLYYLKDENTTLGHYGPEPWQDAGIPTPTLRHLYQDKYDNIWIVSNRGVHVMRSMHDNTKRFIPNTFRNQKEQDAILQVILHLVKQDDHLLWWVNRRNELIRYDEQTGDEKIYPIPNRNEMTINETRGMALSDKLILLTTNSGDIHRFDTQTGRFLSDIPSKDVGGNILSSNNFLSPYANADGRIWLPAFVEDFNIGQTEGNPVIHREFKYWNTQSNQLETFRCLVENSKLGKVLGSSNFHSSFQFEDYLWLIPQLSISNVLFKISLKDKICTHYQLSTTPDLTYALIQKERNNFWLVHGNKISQIANDNRILYEQTVPIKSIDYATNDGNGNFLIYGNGSLWRFDTSTKIWIPLFTSEIILDIKSGIKPVFDRNSKTFYILHHQGIFAINTEKPLQLATPRLAYTSIKIGAATQTLFEHKPELNISYLEPVEISYVAVPLVPSKLLRYRYRLAPDQAWEDLKDNAKLIFTRLPPGKFTLEMQAAFTYQDFGTSEYLRFTVNPPWWRTYTAYAIYTLSLLLLLSLLISWLRARDRLRNAYLTVSLFENTSEGLCILSRELTILRINQAMQTMVGWFPGDSLEFLLENTQCVDHTHSLKEILLNLKDHDRWQGEAHLINPLNGSFIAELRVDRLKYNDPSGHFIVVAEDITARKEQENRLFHLSRYDFLTHLPNRLCFDEHLDNLLTTIPKTDCRFALILLDLDDFKTVNDSLGHKAGDLLLQSIANDLTELLKAAPNPEKGLVARHSGDEFIIIVKAPEHQQIYFQAWLRHAFSKLQTRRFINKSEISISATMGITFLPNNSTDPGILLQQADMAMYQAKREGKGQYSMYSEKLDTELRYQIEIENAILHNTGHFGLEVFYQPKINIATQSISGLEALSRWRLASGELLSPAIFLPFIRSGLMNRLFSLAVIHQACKDLLKFHIIKPQLKMSINVSPQHLEDDDFVDQICVIVDEYNLPHSLIILEILEDAGISNHKVLENIRKIRHLHFGISIDDFGTGYSSLSHLNQLMADELKIDRSFLKGIPGDAKAEKLFINILELGKRFEMAIVCEGIETSDQLNFLTTHGGTYYQGYYFSPPVQNYKIMEFLYAELDEPF